jgi:hypothetical protein
MAPVPENNRAEQLAGELHRVGLSGTRTADLSRLVAVANGLTGGQIPGGGPQQPSGTNLLAAYKAWRERQTPVEPQADAQQIGDLRGALVDVQTRFEAFAAKQVQVSHEELERTRRKQAGVAARKLKNARHAVALATPAAVEDRAIRKSHKAMRKVAEQGGNGAAAGPVGFRAYQKHGGRLGLAAWKNRVARGA